MKSEYFGIYILFFGNSSLTQIKDVLILKEFVHSGILHDNKRRFNQHCPPPAPTPQKNTTRPSGMMSVVLTRRGCLMVEEAASRDLSELVESQAEVQLHHKAPHPPSQSSPRILRAFCPSLKRKKTTMTTKRSNKL